MIPQPVSSTFPCSPLLSGTWRTPGLSIPWCCLPTSSSVCLVFFPLSLCLARWFWPDLMNGRHDHITAVRVSLRWSGGLRLFICLFSLKVIQSSLSKEPSLTSHLDFQYLLSFSWSGGDSHSLLFHRRVDADGDGVDALGFPHQLHVQVVHRRLLLRCCRPHHRQPGSSRHLYRRRRR